MSTQQPPPLLITLAAIVLTTALLVACSDDPVTNLAQSADPTEDTGPDDADQTPDVSSNNNTPDATEGTADADGSIEDTALDTSAGEDTQGEDTAAPTDTDTADAPTTPDATDDVAIDTAEPDVPVPDTIVERCFGDISGGEFTAPDYDQFEPTVGSHCSGTNHQDISGVEKVVFFGDSVTQGTPNARHPLCIENEHFYRNLLAEMLADHFALDRGEGLDWAQWKTYSCLYDGEPGKMEAGDFKNCSKWGARTDDFRGDANCGAADTDNHAQCCAQCCTGGVCEPDGTCIRAAGSPATDALCGSGNKQVDRCLPTGTSDENTLFVFTMGGNDLAALTKDGAEFTEDTPEGLAEIEAGYPSVWQTARDTVTHLEETIKYLKDPARFPNGSHVLFASMFEFTDGTGDVDACSPETINIAGFGDWDVSDLGLNLAEIGGFGSWARPEAQREIVIWINEQFMRIAVDHGADMIFMLESFCGHGYVATGANADTSNACYRPDNPELWFDVSCIHPSDAGHRAIFKLFRDLVLE